MGAGVQVAGEPATCKPATRKPASNNLPLFCFPLWRAAHHKRLCAFQKIFCVE